jgi:hypothetical protein
MVATIVKTIVYSASAVVTIVITVATIVKTVVYNASTVIMIIIIIATVVLWYKTTYFSRSFLN